MNKNNPFQGEKQCFCKQTNKKQREKKGLGPTAPKHTCRVASTQTQEENAEKSKTRKEERGSFKRSLFQIRKNSVERRAPENSEKPSAPQPQADFWQRPDSNPNRDRAARRKRAKNFTNWSPPGKNGEKHHFQNHLSSAAPSLSSPIWSKIRTSEENKFVRPPKMILKNLCSIEAIQRVQRK